MSVEAEEVRGMRVAILGASGMLGSMMLDMLGETGEFDLVGTLRESSTDELLHGARLKYLDASSPSKEELARVLDGCAWAINCIGVIKHHIQDRQRETTERAIRVNALFPHLLAEAAGVAGCQVLQIATDCVYSGAKGAYLESDPHDAWDAYGKSKSLGEVAAPWMHHLRCSIIGPEIGRDRRSLLEWFLSHSAGKEVMGYTNHLWNGVTTLHFARVCQGILRENMALPHLTHFIPADVLPKGELLECIRTAFDRQDIQVNPKPAAQAVDRSLATADPALNRRLWSAAGYSEPPTLSWMIEELAVRCSSRRRARA